MKLTDGTLDGDEDGCEEGIDVGQSDTEGFSQMVDYWSLHLQMETQRGWKLVDQIYIY